MITGFWLGSWRARSSSIGVLSPASIPRWYTTAPDWTARKTAASGWPLSVPIRNASAVSASAASVSPAIWARRDRIVARCPVEHWLVESLGNGPGDLEATIHLDDVAGAQGDHAAEVGGPEERHRVTECVRRSRRASVDHASDLVEQMRHGQRQRDVVEDPHDGGVVAGGVGRWRAPRRPVPGDVRGCRVGELDTERGEDEGARRVVVREPIEGQLEDRGPGRRRRCAALENMPRLLARAAATSRSVSSMSAARRAASRRVSRNAASPVWRCAVPRPIARSMPTSDRGRRTASKTVEGRRVVPQSVAGGERGERGIGGPL